MPQTSSPWVWVGDDEYRLNTREGSEHGPWTLSRRDGTWYLSGGAFQDWQVGHVSLSHAHWEAFGRIVTHLAHLDVAPMDIIVLSYEKDRPEK